MKIALISPNTGNLRDMADALGGSAHHVVTVEGGKTKMRAAAEQEVPDLILVEGMCCDPNELSQVEYISTHHPQVAVVLLCATHTPEFLMQSMRAGVREVLPSPSPPEALRAMVARVEAKLKGSQGKRLGKILAFLPCKGGSGSTFLATNLGYHLSETSSVLLIDLNLQFGDALSFVHDGKPATTLTDVAHSIGRLDASLLAASAVSVAPNYNILAAPEDLAQAMEIKPEHVEAILALAVTQYDFVLLDMSRILDTLSIKALDRAYRIFPVIQASLPSIHNASKLLGAFRSLGYATDKTEVIVNRFEKSGPISTDDLRKSLGKVVVRTVPNSYKDVNSSIDQGTVLAKVARSNAVAKTLMEFADSLNPRQDATRGLLGRLFKRA
jgi:pilus assembly protein CpaE